jgi:hypothetical protein
MPSERTLSHDRLQEHQLVLELNHPRGKDSCRIVTLRLGCLLLWEPAAAEEGVRMLGSGGKNC